MNQQIHILNGDALREQFPKKLGNYIVVRECMIEGDVRGKEVSEILINRANYLEKRYGIELGSYADKVLPEFKKLESHYPEVNLWFEDDLFCQLNLWFICFYLAELNYNNQLVYLIRPERDLQYGFGAYSSDELIGLFNNKILITPKNIQLLAKCWRLYQLQNFSEIEALISESDLPFIQASVSALIEWKGQNAGIGKPKDTLLRLKQEFGNKNFHELFKAFSKALPIYGFGDTQVKQMIDELD